MSLGPFDGHTKVPCYATTDSCSPVIPTPVHSAVQPTVLNGPSTIAPEVEDRPKMAEDELANRMRAVNAISEETDPQLLDRVCPGWAEIVTALQDWLDAEQKGSRLTHMHHDYLVNVEEAVIRDEWAVEDPFAGLCDDVVNGKTTAREAMSTIVRRYSADMCKVGDLAAAFEQAGAPAIAAECR